VRVLGKSEELKTGLPLRLANPGYFCTRFDSLSRFWRLDAQAYASLVEGVNSLERETVFAQVEYDATIVGDYIDICKRTDALADEATPLARARRFLGIEW
jgi:hypothetical protein